ncbi:MAG: winged helix-turn-helix domain-containing protein [Bernardetiaceae bacterium]
MPATIKEVVFQLDGAINHRFRLGIMSILLHHPTVEFNELKRLLGLTEGNLASHLRGLEKIEYIAVHKQFVGRRPNTRYRLTNRGKKAFLRHQQALEQLVNANRQAFQKLQVSDE